MAFAQAVDRRVGHLAEVLAEELADEPRLVGDDRERRVVAHRSDRLLRALHHRRQDQLHVLQRLPGRDLAARELGAGVAHDRIALHRRQVRLGQELPDHAGIVLLARDAVLHSAVFEHDALDQIDRDHLPRPQPPLGDDGRLGYRHHADLRSDDQQPVAGAHIAQGAQRVAVHPRHRPAPVRHRERGGPVPRLHDAGEIPVHGDMAARHVVGGRFRHKHQLGGGRVAAGAADRLEHRIQRRGVGRAGGDHRLDVLRMLAERDRRHADLVAQHPVLVAANRVDLAIVRQTPERLRQPPLREGVGGIALVEDRHPALEPRIAQVGIEDRQALRQEQALVDDRPARQRTDVEALDLRRDHALLDPAADEVQLLLELGVVDIVGTGDHDLLDLGPRRLRLQTDHRHVDRHLTPAVDGVAALDDRALDDRAATLLRAQIGARQEDHAHGEPAGPGLVPRGGDAIVEEPVRQIEVQPGAVPGLAVRVDSAAMPHGLQRIDRGLNDTARRLAVGGRDEADAAGVGFELGAIHALGGEAGALVCHRIGHALGPFGSKFMRSNVRRIASCPTCAPAAMPIGISLACRVGRTDKVFCPSGLS